MQGEIAPKGRTMGCAGAIVGGEDDTASAKKNYERFWYICSRFTSLKKVAEVLKIVNEIIKGKNILITEPQEE